MKEIKGNNRKRKRVWKSLGYISGLVAISALLRILFVDEYGVDILSSYYLLFLGIAFFLYLDWTLVRGKTKTNLLCCAGMMIGIFAIRGARYGYFWDLNQLMRYLWYLYYIPLLLIPYFSMRAAYFLGKYEETRTPVWLKVSGVLAVILMTLVLTNDSHQLVFGLHPGFRQEWRDEYTYHFFYFIACGWINLQLIGSVGVLIYKCRIPDGRRYAWMLMIPILLGMIWLLLMALGIIPFWGDFLPIEFPETFVFSTAGTWICCIQIGLIPANSTYAELFHISTVGAVIVDRNGTVKYRSENATDVFALRDEESYQLTEDVLIRREEIRGGYVYWKTDIREINRTNRELETIQKQWLDDADWIRLQNELREKDAATKAKNSVYDAIAVKVMPQSKKISELSMRLEDSLGEKQKENLGRICIYGSYIKRMANLMLLAAQGEQTSETELALAIAESLRQLSKQKIQTVLYTDAEKKMYPSDSLLEAYELFEKYLEQLLPGLKAIQVTLKNGVCRVVAEGACPDSFKCYENTVAEWDEESCFIKISLEKAGEAGCI